MVKMPPDTALHIVYIEILHNQFQLGPSIFHRQSLIRWDLYTWRR